MKWTATGISLIVLALIGSATMAAQHQMGEQMPTGSQSAQHEQPTGQQPMMGQGMMGQGMMGMPMMGMICPMMPGGMGRMGMMQPMMGGGQMDAKAMGRMLQLRGDILKAVGDVLLKHGMTMEQSK